MRIQELLKKYEKEENIRLITYEEVVLYEGDVEGLCRLLDCCEVRGIKVVEGVTQIKVDYDMEE